MSSRRDRSAYLRSDPSHNERSGTTGLVLVLQRVLVKWARSDSDRVPAAYELQRLLEAVDYHMGTGNIVYDNLVDVSDTAALPPSTAIAGGSIVIHK